MPEVAFTYPRLGYWWMVVNALGGLSGYRRLFVHGDVTIGCSLCAPYRMVNSEAFYGDNLNNFDHLWLVAVLGTLLLINTFFVRIFTEDTGVAFVYWCAHCLQRQTLALYFSSFTFSELDLRDFADVSGDILCCFMAEISAICSSIVGFSKNSFVHRNVHIHLYKYDRFTIFYVL